MRQMMSLRFDVESERRSNELLEPRGIKRGKGDAQGTWRCRHERPFRQARHGPCFSDLRNEKSATDNQFRYSTSSNMIFIHCSL